MALPTRLQPRLVRVQEKGQVTLPADMRRHLGLKKGDLVAVTPTDGGVLIKPVEVRDVPAVSRDAKDDKFLATAVAGRAASIVSENRDLLDIEEYEGIPIIAAAAFLALLEAGASRGPEDVGK